MSHPSAWPGFSSDEFLETVRDIYAPRARKAIIECDGYHVRTLVTGRDRAMSRFFPFPFMLEPVEVPLGADVVHVTLLRDVVVGVTRVGEPKPHGSSIAPFVKWNEFPSWEAFLAVSVPPPGVDSPRTVERKKRKLERDHGPLCFTFVDDDPDVFETLIRWKSDQYRRTGGVDRLGIRQNVDFYRECRRRGIFTATSLRAGGRLVAGKIGYRAGKRHIARLTVYDPDPALRVYSPGAVAELETLRASFESGDHEFDYQAGGQPYKFAYATHARWIAAVGKEPALARWQRRLRAKLGTAAVNQGWYRTYKEGIRRARRAARIG